MKYFLTFLISIYFFLSVSAQQKMSSTQFEFQFDSLTTLKTDLLKQIEILKTEIDTLNSKIEFNTSLLKECDYRRMIKKYGKEVAGRLAAERIWKGMTEDMLLEIWGNPDKVTSKKEKWGNFTQYYYGKITFFFKNKKLIDWEEEK